MLSHTDCRLASRTLPSCTTLSPPSLQHYEPLHYSYIYTLLLLQPLLPRLIRQVRRFSSPSSITNQFTFITMLNSVYVTVSSTEYSYTKC